MTTRRELSQHTAETAAETHEGIAHGGDRYLAIFEPGSSRVVSLPREGEIIIGRSADVSLRLDDPSVSRRHAKLVVEEKRAFVLDLESQNGTFVDGERIEGAHLLVSGEAIEISQSALVFHDRRPAALVPSALTLTVDAMREHVTRELERSRVTGRTVPLLVVSCDESSAHERMRTCIERNLDGLERFAIEGAHRGFVLLPELERDEAERRATVLTRALEAWGAPCSIGVAHAPEDGCDAETLMGSARAAASLAHAGTVVSAHDAVRVVQLGQEAALVADAAMLRVYALAERLAQSDLPVLVHGETGSGKELLAIAIHHFSETRRARRLVSLNCAALAETLIESELFGHERGAFTGASTSRVGLLEAANGGTVFLDEVAELTPSTQAKLLRALDARRIMRLGDTVERPIDVRIVAATHRDLSKEVAAGRFRSDLYFRLSGATLWVSPLRDRPRELVLLARRFLEEACRRAGRSPMRMSDDAVRTLVSHAWPGNVRELRYVIDYLVAAHDDAVLDAWHFEERLGKPATQAPEAPAPCSTSGFRAIEDEVRELESARMREALAMTSGNQRRAAQLISMPLRTFVTKLARYGIKV